MRVRKKPVEIEAVRFIELMNGVAILDGGTLGGAGFPQWFTEGERKGQQSPNDHEPGSIWVESDQLYLQTNSGRAIVNRGDWVIRGINGELYPCEDAIFFVIHEPA